MPRLQEPEPLNLAEVFRKAQDKMMGDLSLGRVIAHAPTQGAASEQQWLTLLKAYLPEQYRAAPAFVVNAAGQRSWQIDLVIYDNERSPLLFPHTSGIHLPIEAVYAVFEVKTLISRASIRDAGAKAASVRALRSGSAARPILGGMLATSSVWAPHKFSTNLGRILKSVPAHQQIDLGCALEQGAFERDKRLTVSAPEEALIFLVLRLVARLNALGPAPPADLMSYVRTLESFKRWTES